MVNALRSFFFLLLLLVAACVETTVPVKEEAIRTAVSFSDLPGWKEDHLQQALPALTRSCSVLKKKNGWSDLCAALEASPPHNDQEARQFFERWFQPYAQSNSASAQGLFTGYYEAELQGALQQGGSYQTPLFGRPDDLVTVDLGAFKSSLQGQTIAGKIVNSKNGKKLEPYDNRAQIVDGSLTGRAQPLVWVNDPVDAFFLAIQGSGQVHLTDDTVLRVGYDSTNSRPYVAIGKILAERNEIAKPVTMQSIRAWIKQHPEKARQVMDLNTSYVFFRILKDDGPIGAEGVALTPLRSLAVDPAFITLGTPVWLDTTDGKGAPLQRLVMAQDTGGAIKGVVRGDVFWGYGAEAESQAGAMQNTGRYFVFLPKMSTGNASF